MRPKLVRLRTDSPVAFPQYAKYRVPWDDVVITLKPRPVRLRRSRERVRRNNRHLLRGLELRYFPMFENIDSLRSEIANEERRRDEYLDKLAAGEQSEVVDDWGLGLDPELRCIDYRESADRYEAYAAKSRETLQLLLAAPDGIYVEPNTNEDASHCPGVYVTWPLDRKGMEKAVRLFLASEGYNNVRLRWEKGDAAYVIIPN